MATEAIPVLWLCGPPAVGKTSVGWDIYSHLIQSGVDAGYVDIDQLGICFLEPASDPGRDLMKARNLGVVVASYQRAGARCVVVSGVVDPQNGIPADALPVADLTVVRLRVQPDELRRRLATRGAQAEPVDDVLREARDLEATTFADLCLDTTDMPVADVVQAVLDQTGNWPFGTGRGYTSRKPAPTAQVERPTDGSVVWLCGARGVGKSAVGFALYQAVLQAGRMAAYVDLDQLGFCGTGPIDHEIRARNVAGVWRTFAEAGARHLVVVGPIEDKSSLDIYAEVLSNAPIDLFRLHAGPETLTARIMLRGEGVNWLQPGDPLKGKPAEHLRRTADHAATDNDALERASIGSRVETDDRSVGEIAHSILDKSGWLR